MCSSQKMSKTQNHLDSATLKVYIAQCSHGVRRVGLRNKELKGLGQLHIRSVSFYYQMAALRTIMVYTRWQ